MDELVSELWDAVVHWIQAAEAHSAEGNYEAARKALENGARDFADAKQMTLERINGLETVMHVLRGQLP